MRNIKMGSGNFLEMSSRVKYYNNTELGKITSICPNIFMKIESTEQTIVQTRL